jgi:hypothetical protein
MAAAFFVLFVSFCKNFTQGFSRKRDSGSAINSERLPFGRHTSRRRPQRQFGKEIVAEYAGDVGEGIAVEEKEGRSPVAGAKVSRVSPRVVSSSRRSCQSFSTAAKLSDGH